MALSTTSLTSYISATATKAIGLSVLTAQTTFDTAYRLANGTGASSATDVVDANLTANGTATALSGLTTTLGEAFGTKTRLKAVTFHNPATNTGNITITSTITGLPVGVLQPDSEISYRTNSATGLTITSSNTITATGTVTTENLRVILVVA